MPIADRLRHGVAWRLEDARSRIAAARTYASRRLLAPVRPGTPTSRILCYHSVGTPHWGVNDVSPRRFAEQLTTLLESGCRVVPATELRRGTPDPTSPPRVALTFDDGARSVLDRVAPVLADLGVPWTAFVVTAWADGRHRHGHDLVLDWTGIERIAELGATIASHSVSHPNFSTLSAQEASDQLGESRDAIRRRLGIDTREFAIPVGRAQDWTPDAARAALDAGYTSIYSATEHRRPAGTIPRTFITSFDDERVYRAALAGALDDWQEWL